MTIRNSDILSDIHRMTGLSGSILSRWWSFGKTRAYQCWPPGTDGTGNCVLSAGTADFSLMKTHHC